MDSTNLLFAKIEAIALTPGKKDKQALVAQFSEYERSIVKLALDPTVNYYIKKLPPPTTSGTAEWEEAEFKLLADLAARRIGGNAAHEQIGFSLRELSPDSGELLRRVILKDLRCGAGTTITNAAFPGLIPDFAYMRCTLPKDSNYEKWDWSVGIISQLKANGMFARIDHDSDGNVLITTRQGNTFPRDALNLLAEDVQWTTPRGTQIHGELTVWKGGVLQSRAEGNGLLNSLQNDGEIPVGYDIRFDAWDLIPLAAAVVKGSCKLPYKGRYQTLLGHITTAGRSRIQAIESRLVFSKAEAMEHYRQVLAQKLEGTVVKHPDAIWRDGDSKDQVKFKLEVDVDLKITGFREGTDGKRTADTFGSVVCQSLDGELEVAVSGFKREMELYLHENRDSVLGKIMCVRANEVSLPSESNVKHSLFHPRFVELRNDKYEADTLPEVIAQFEAACA
jgi:DNA ligase-1